MYGVLGLNFLQFVVLKGILMTGGYVAGASALLGFGTGGLMLAMAGAAGPTPGRWSRNGALLDDLSFLGGCFMTPNAHLASMYCADWQARQDKHAFIQLVIDEVFRLGDPEELLAHGFIDGTEDDGYRRTA